MQSPVKAANRRSDLICGARPQEEPDPESPNLWSHESRMLDQGRQVLESAGCTVDMRVRVQ